MWIYLSTTKYAVSSVLIKQEETEQKPIYFVSHALSGPELRYTEVEKVALALLVTARKLRPYFLSHPITVLTNTLLGRITTHPELSGKMVKWSVELSEYDIEYRPRTSIKAQVLADFLIEGMSPFPTEVWKVFVDGAVSREGCGVEVLLVSMTGEKMKISIRMGSRFSNNESEYESVLAGMKAALNLGATRIIIL